MLVRACTSVGVAPRPKLHMLAEMVVQCIDTGGPVWGATWQDEDLNGAIKTICQSASKAPPHTFCARVLNSFDASHGLRCL